MSQKLTAGLPPAFDIGVGYTVRLTAVDPTTGADVTTVKVSNVAIMAAAVVSEASLDDTPDFAPLFLPIPSEPPAAEAAP